MGKTRAASGQRARGDSGGCVQLAPKGRTWTGAAQRPGGGHRSIGRWLQQVLDEASACAGKAMLARACLTAPCTRVGPNLVACSGHEAGSGVSVRALNPGQDPAFSHAGTKFFAQECLFGSGTSAGTPPSSGQGPRQVPECVPGVGPRTGPSLIEGREPDVGSGVLLGA